jgi:hypothetical protein
MCVVGAIISLEQINLTDHRAAFHQYSIAINCGSGSASDRLRGAQFAAWGWLFSGAHDRADVALIGCGLKRC